MILDALPILERLKEHFPEVEAFRAPFEESQLDRQTSGRHIDLANAIFECVGKNAQVLGVSGIRLADVEGKTGVSAVKPAQKFFERYDPNFTNSTWEFLVSAVGPISGKRNSSGDISHGHLSTKPELSSGHAMLCLNLALSFAAYFFSTLELYREIPENPQVAKMDYDEHKEKRGFNEWLDERGEGFGEASYSWLMYLHDYARYESMFDEFQYSSAQI